MKVQFFHRSLPPILPDVVSASSFRRLVEFCLARSQSWLGREDASTAGLIGGEEPLLLDLHHIRLFIVVLAATLGIAPRIGAAEVRYETFSSASLGRDVSYALRLPASYATGKRTYPVLYVLHGLFEGPAFWERRGLEPILEQLETQGEIPELLIVAVDGGNSFFVNTPSARYEDLVTRDLTAHVESAYRVVKGRSGRALLGVSMGGYAALRIALSQPQAFGAAATHSAMLLLKLPNRDEGAGRGQMAAFNRVFGDPIDAELWTRSDPLTWADKADPRSAPPLYFDCGSEDRYGLAAGNQELHRRLEARRVAHEFALRPGDHGYEYVRSVLPRSLRFLGKALGGGRTTSK